MCDYEITEANLPNLLEQMTDAELVLALQLLRLAKEYNCDLRGAASAMKLRKKKNETSELYYRQHKTERTAYNTAYMREWRAKKAERGKKVEKDGGVVCAEKTKQGSVIQAAT